VTDFGGGKYGHAVMPRNRFVVPKKPYREGGRKMQKYGKVIHATFIAILFCLPLLSLPGAHAKGGGTPANIYVMGGAEVGGDGTKNKPYSSLAEVEANSLPGDKITVLFSDTALDGGLTLKESQHIQGKRGKKQDKHSLPVVTNSDHSSNDGNGIIAASNTRISELNIRDTAQNGIYFFNASNVCIQKNLIENPNSIPALNPQGAAAIFGQAINGHSTDVLIEDNVMHARAHDAIDTFGVVFVSGNDAFMSGVVQGNHVSEMNGRAYFPVVNQNGVADFAFYDNSAKTIGPSNADSFFVFGGDSGDITVDVKNYYLDNSEIGVLGDPTNHGFEVWNGPIVPGSGIASTVRVTADQIVIHVSAADGIFVANTVPEGQMEVSIKNSEVLRAAGRLTGGIGAIGQNPFYGFPIPFNNSKLSLLIETTDVIATLPGINLWGTPIPAIAVFLSGINDVIDLGSGALGSAGQNRIIDNPLDYAVMFNFSATFAQKNYYGGGAPTIFQFNTAPLFADQYLVADPRP
jgi:hypothetical protein